MTERGGERERTRSIGIEAVSCDGRGGELVDFCHRFFED